MGLRLKLIRNYAIQILQSLKILREHSIVHCDLKPENIMLDDSHYPKIKLIDFGSSCFEKDQIYTYIQSRFYRAPEIMLGICYTSAIDMWSLGCVLAELFTGFPLFPGENEPEQMSLIMEVNGIPPVELIKVILILNFYSDQLEVKFSLIKKINLFLYYQRRVLIKNHRAKLYPKQCPETGTHTEREIKRQLK